MDQNLTPHDDPDWAAFLQAQREWTELDEAFWSHQPTRGAAYMNRLLRRASALKARLRSSADWPARVEVLLTDPNPGIRLDGALELARWDVGRALPIVEGIARGSATGARRSATYAALRLRAELASGGPAAAPSPEPTGVPSAIPEHPIEDSEEARTQAEAVLLVHGAIMSGGFDHALALDREHVTIAITGYERIGLREIADMLRSVAGQSDRADSPGITAAASPQIEGIEGFDDRYEQLVPNDSYLGDLIDRYLDARVV
jgi:hypothetical protein